VERVVASVIALAMLSISGSAGLLHVHAYTGHDHAEHRHGPASHAHAPAVHHHEHDADAPGEDTELETCDPADHMVSLAVTCVAAESLATPLPGVIGTFVLAAPRTTVGVVAPADVRAHSPPRLTDAPLRAPPAIPAV
jgi:hypothetical protein